MFKFIIGIDEAGRGPLAGPATVGAFVADEKIGRRIIKTLFNGKLRDSKKLSPKRREEIFKQLLVLKKKGEVNFSVAHISNIIIDRNGITKAVRGGVEKCLNNLKIENLLKIKNCKLEILLDGLLRAPAEYKNQKTIIKGDEKDVFIACASIVAKVLRDRLMCQLAKKYPAYSFEIHKGYGTALHRSLILKHGLSPLHRITYCKALVIG